MHNTRSVARISSLINTHGLDEAYKKSGLKMSSFQRYVTEAKKRGLLDEEGEEKEEGSRESEFDKEVALQCPEIEGITAEENVDFEKEIMPYLEKIGQRALGKNQRERTQKIKVKGFAPFAIVMLSDVHGGGKTDYTKLREDIDIIRNEERMYAILAGDETDNFIMGKLMSIQKEQPTTFDMEFRFLKWYLESLQDSLIAVCSGNHNNWSRKLSGIDTMRELLQGVPSLYDTDQVVFDLEYFGGMAHKYMVRHKYRHSSIFNPTHGQEVFWERGGVDFDVSIGGHTHVATLCRPFVKHDKKRFAVLLGTYKVRDGYQREIGFAPTYSKSRGSGALVYHPDGRDPMWCDDLSTARDLLRLWGEG